jgi:hypothetical protein
MSIELIPYIEQLRDDWERFIFNSINGNFLHSRSFYDHNPSNNTDDCSFLFYKKKKLIAVLPCNLYEKEGLKILQSHLRSTYGGFIINEEVGVKEAVEIVEKLIVTAKALKVNEIIVRNPFRILNKTFCDETDYAMWFHGFSIKQRELEMAIQLTDKQSVEHGYANSTQRSINKGKQFLIITESNDYEKFWSVLNKNLADKYQSSPTHNYSAFLSLLENIGSEKIKLFVAKKDNEIIAGVLLFILNKKAIHAQYIASDLSFQEYRPLNALIDHIAAWGCDNKYQWFNLGMANENNGKIINYGLFKFKEGFGSRGVLRETMHLILNGNKIG